MNKAEWLVVRDDENSSLRRGGGGGGGEQEKINHKHRPPVAKDRISIYSKK